MIIQDPQLVARYAAVEPAGAELASSAAPATPFLRVGLSPSRVPGRLCASAVREYSTACRRSLPLPHTVPAHANSGRPTTWQPTPHLVGRPPFQEQTMIPPSTRPLEPLLRHVAPPTESPLSSAPLDYEEYRDWKREEREERWERCDAEIDRDTRRPWP